jgi:pimeloyl-ACP methyl ester carboxylesterase
VNVPYLDGPWLRSRRLDVDGVSIAYETSDDASPSAPTFMLVHGGNAHGGWWTAVSRRLRREGRVIVPELSGHGASDHRVAGYSPELWCDELVKILDVEGGGPIVLVGHSMGGRVALHFALLHPDRVMLVIAIDTVVQEGDVPRGRGLKPFDVLPSREEALARFRVLRDSPYITEVTRQALSERGLVQTPEGWTWSGDFRTTGQFTDSSTLRDLRLLQRPAGLIYAGHSNRVTDAGAAFFEAQSRLALRPIRIDASTHDIPVDAPEECARAIVTMAEPVLGRGMAPSS